MSMHPYFYWHQNSNNIEIVPSVPENVNNAGNIYLPACDQVSTNCVLPAFHENKVVINYGNVHFSGCVDTPNYVCNPYISEVTNTPHGISSHTCSKYSYHNSNNLVDLTGLNYHNPTHTYSPYTRSLEDDIKLFDYDRTERIESHNKPTYSHEKDYDFEVKLPPVSTHPPYDNFVIPESTMPVEVMSTKSRIMKKYTKYDDLRDILEERHTNHRVEPISSKNKQKEDSRDLKHLLRRRRTEKMESISNIEDKRDRSIHRELVQNNIKLKRTIQDIQKAKNSLSKLKNSSNILDRKYPQNSIKRNPGLLERKTLSKSQKSNLSPDALKRYLAYQRFLRNCYKSQSPSPQKILKTNKTKDFKDEYSSHVKDKAPKRLKCEEKSEIVKSTSSSEQIKIKDKSNRKVSSHINQKDRKEHSTSKTSNNLSLKTKKRESKEKVADNVDKNVKKDVSRPKKTLDVEEKKRTEEINEKIAKYLEKKRKRQEIKERLFGSDDRKKEKTEAEAKLLQYLKQNRKQTTKSNDVNKTEVNKITCKSIQNKRDDDIDLRTVLTRKRSKNLSLKESKRIKTTKSQQENVTITVEQDVNNKAEPEKVTHTKSKVKTIKTKRIKLVINIVCPNSASDDSDETTKDPCTSPHPDLSFLDDFNVDEIVDSLDISSTKYPVSNNIDFEDINMNVSENENECNIAPMKQLTNMNEDNNNPPLHDDPLTEVESNMAPNNNESYNNKEQQIEDCHNQLNDCNPSREKDIDEKTKISISDETALNATISNVDMVSEHCEKDKGEQVINISDATVIDATNNNATVQRHCEKENDKQIINISDKKAKDTICSIINVDPEYCDDVYEVIDISEDVHINTTVLADIIDLDSNDHHDNINSMTKSSENFKEKAETILEKSDMIIQNIEKSNDSKDTSNGTVATTSLVTQAIGSLPFINEGESTSSEEIIIPTQEKNHQDNLNIENINTAEKEPVLFLASDLNSRNIMIDISKNIDGQNIEPLKVNDLATQETKIDMKSNIIVKSDIDKDSLLIAKTDNALFNISDRQVTIKNNHDNTDVDEEKYNKTKSENSTNQSEKAILEKNESISDNIDMKETKSDKIKIVSKPEEPVNDTFITNSANTKITKASNVATDEERITIPTSDIQPDKIPSKPIQNQINSVAKSVSNVANNTVAANKVVKNKETVKGGQANTIISPKIRNPYVRGIEKRMTEYLNTKFSITELVHRGYYSSIYKCRDPVGKTYALKVIQFKYRSLAIYRDKMLMDLQKSTTEDNYVGILRMLESFNCSGEWCFLSEFYPKTLKQALLENGKCFHIDLVQILSRQLVAAVTMLTNNQIVHADIKPSHILLNSTNDRLKLCSFDRSDFNYNIRIIPSSGTSSYRAPEMILGYDADYRIDVWSTALVMYEMATNIKLFPGRFNNDILYKQLCTLGPLNYDMLENCTLRNMHFLGSKFMRQLDNQKWVFVQFSGINNKLRHKLFTSYNRDWRPSRTQWQITEDLDKIEMLYKLLKQMLTMDPRHRLPITYVQANEFIYDYISDREIQ